MKQQSHALLLISTLFTAGCSSIGPFVDPAEPDNLEGPGIFSGEKGYLQLTDTNSLTTEYKTGLLEQTEEYTRFQQWMTFKSLDKNSDEYQKFLQWQAHLLTRQTLKIEPANSLHCISLTPI